MWNYTFYYLFMLCISEIFASNDTCHEITSKQKNSAKRFSAKQLNWICDRSNKWDQMVNVPQAEKAHFRTTLGETKGEIEQSAWLKKVRGCRGSKCLTDVVKCVDKTCKEEGLEEAEMIPEEVLGLGAPTYSGVIPIFVPFPDYTVQIEDILNYNVDKLDPKNLLEQSEDIQSCEKRMFLANVCHMVLKSSNAKEAFAEQIIAFSKDISKVTKDLEKQFNKFQNKCNISLQVLSKNNKRLGEVKPCGDITEVKHFDKKAISQKCIQVMMAKTALEAFPELKSNITTVYANNLLVDEYGRWLDKCRFTRDILLDKDLTFEHFINDFLSQDHVNGHTVAPTKLGKLATKENISEEVHPFSVFRNATVDLRAYRKEVRMMSDGERRKYLAAIQQLKTQKIHDLSKYDLLVEYHTPQDSPGAHFGPAFLPFHREFLKQFEIALRQIDSTVSLAYWDSTLDDGLPSRKDSILWTPEFFGNGDGTVIEGPFSYWNISTGHIDNDIPMLIRQVGFVDEIGLMKNEDIDYVLGKTKYDDLQFCKDDTFEGAHGMVHGFVGGFMGSIPSAANDPIFFMHHCFIDYIWEQFRQIKQSVHERESNYTVDSDVCKENHKADDPMKPFTIKNREGLSNDYARELAFYEPRPTCSKFNPTCASPYLYCNIKNYRCLSKIKPNGNCTGFDGTDICYASECVKGLCQISYKA